MIEQHWTYCLLCKGTGSYKSILTGKARKCGQCENGLVCKRCLQGVRTGTVVFTAKAPALASIYIRCDECNWAEVA